MKLSALLSAAASASLFTLSSAAACTANNGNSNPPAWFTTGVNKAIIAISAYTDPEAAAAAASLQAYAAAAANSLISNAIKIKVKRQASAFECKSTETCYSSLGYPWCVSNTSHLARDEDDVTWNLDNGDYTLRDGTKGNVYTKPQPYLSFIAGAGATTVATKTTAPGTKTTPATNNASAPTAAGGAGTTGGSSTPAATGGSGSPNGLTGKGSANERTIGGWKAVVGAVGAAVVAAL